MSLRFLAWLAPTALLLLGCGQEASPARARPGARLVSLRPAPDAAAGERRTVASFDVLQTRPDWLFRAARAEVETRADDGRSLLTLSGGVGEQSELEVLIPGRFDPSEINRVAVTLIVPDRRTLRAALLRDGLWVAEAFPQIVEGAAEERTFVLQLGAPSSWDDCDRVSFGVSGEGGPVQLLSLQLLWEPPATALPSIDAPDLVEMQGEWLRVAGLSSRAPLEGALRVPPGAFLKIDYGLPEETRLPGSQSHASLRIQGADGTVRQRTLSFEYEQTVVYTQPDRAEERERWLQRDASRIKNAGQRARALRAWKRRMVKTPEAAFGDLDEKDEQRLEQKRQGPVRPPEGLIDGWLSLSVPLDEFAGQQVTLRLELVEEELTESVCAVAEPRLVVPAHTAPLILLVTSDAHRADGLSAGDPGAAVATPWLDRLAERGVLFRDAWAPANGTLSSHAALMTGVSPRDSGVVRDGQEVPEAALTLAERFSEEGWATLASLSSGLLSPDLSGLGQGFDRVLVPQLSERSASETIEALLYELDELKGTPVFAWVHVREGHAPYEPPERFRREHYPEGVNPFGAELPAPERAPPAWIAGVRDLAYVQALYLAEITWLDRQLQQILEHPRAKRGVVAFAGTFGESLSSFGHARLEPDTLRVPLILAGADLPAGASVEQPVQLADLGRTLLELAGFEAGGFPGTSLARREAEDAPRFAIGEGGREAALAHGGFLLTLQLEGSDRHAARLFALDSGDGAARDVLGEHPERARELRQRLEHWLLGAEQAEAPRHRATADASVLRWLEVLGIDEADRMRRTEPWLDSDCDCGGCASSNAGPE